MAMSMSATSSNASATTSTASGTTSKTCDVCYEDLNNSTYKLVKCDKCQYNCCKQCVRTYFKDILNEPHCMKCKMQWEPEFVVAAVNKSYYNGEFKENRKAVLTNLEKSRLPDTQHDAKLFVLREKLDKRILDIKGEIKNLKLEIKKKEQEMVLAHSEFLKEKTPERKTFIMKCQADCKGFLSTSYKCELCNKRTCPKCFEVEETNHAEEQVGVGIGHGHGHVCKPENVETVTMMKKETKACPGCSVRIYKIDGCNQMWCVECNTAFDWVSGKIVNGQIHNPHYYDYLKKNGGIPRAPGDVICGGLPHIQHMYQKITQLRLSGYIETASSETMIRNVGYVHQFTNHIHHMYLDLVNHDSYQSALKGIRIKYILGRMTDDEFSAAIFKENKKDIKNQKKKQLLQLVDNVGTDLLQNYNASLEKHIDHLSETMMMVRGFVEMLLYFNKLSSKYYSDFNGYIGMIKILVNNKPFDLCDIGPHDVVKYQY